MLIIFKSPASGDVIMFEKNGKEMLSVLGKDPADAKGIVTVEQLPGAIAAVRAAPTMPPAGPDRMASLPWKRPASVSPPR